MAGIGDYEEGKPFALKSGNKPTFKNMGSLSTNGNGTPAYLKSFGVGKGTSPYRQTEVESHAGDPYEYRKTADGNYETRKKGANQAWIVAKGTALDAIKEKYGKDFDAKEAETKTETKTDASTDANADNADTDANTGDIKKSGVDGTGGGEKKKWHEKKGWQMLVQGLTTGLDAVYGTGKVEFEGGKAKTETEEERTAREKKEKENEIKAPTENIVQKEIEK